MKLFVTGGTGFVGREVVRELHAASHQLRLLVRDPASAHAGELASRYGADRVIGTVYDIASIAAGMQGCEAAIHLVGIISEIGENTFENAHVRATRNMLAAAKACGVKRFLHMSALGTRPNAASRYHQTKWTAEESVRGSGLDFTIFRPSLIYGPDDQFVNLFARIIRKSPAVPLIGGGASRVQPISVASVARAFARALETPEACGRTLDLCGAEAITLAQLVSTLLLVMRARRLRLSIPLPLARAQAVVLEWFYARMLRRPAPLTRDQLIMLAEDNVGDYQTAARLFSLSEPAFREGVARWLQTSMP